MKSPTLGFFRNRYFLVALSSLILFGVGATVSYKFDFIKEKNTRVEEQALRFKQGKLSHPLLECDIPEEALGEKHSEIAYFNRELKEFARNMEGRLGVSEVCVYFRDLSNGPWIGSDQELEIVDPSKITLPLFLSLLKQGEKQISFFDREVVYDPARMPAIDIASTITKKTIEPGKHTVGALMEKMMDSNDPVAAKLLKDLVDPAIFSKVLFDLGIEKDYDPSTKTLLKARSLSRFLMVVYNNSYLDHKLSEAAMYIMTNNSFTEALPKWIPKEITVVHNYGAVRAAEKPDEMWSVYDTGVIYYKGMPYALTVITTGQNPKNQTEVIAEVSKFIYQKVDRHMKTQRKNS